MPGTLRFFNPLHRNCHPRATKHVTKESRANHFESTPFATARAGESKTCRSSLTLFVTWNLRIIFPADAATLFVTTVAVCYRGFRRSAMISADEKLKTGDY